MNTFFHSFIATDEGGQAFELFVFTKQLDKTTFGGTHRKAVIDRVELEDGTPVNHKGKGRYEILTEPPTLVTSDDPNAP